MAWLCVLAISSLIFTASQAFPQEKILYNFAGSKIDGGTPEAALIFDSAGNLYGSTFYGNEYNYGSVFELTPTGTGRWIETVLHVFGGTGDGYYPRQLVFDNAGNLYGATEEGGVYGQGTVFELSPLVDGTWTETLLHEFGSGHDGQQPISNLIFDASGNLYGTTNAGGSDGSGTVFKLTPNARGTWTENILHSFKHDGVDGSGPGVGLIFDTSGNLYGTTVNGGTLNKGAVFQLTPTVGGKWSETTLYSFGSSKDGKFPWAGVIFDKAGNLYGTTGEGGDHANGGTVFQLTPEAGGLWSESILHNFGQSDQDGNYPGGAGLILDTSGNLYGTTNYGGTYAMGTVFELTPAEGGSWAETILHRFGNGKDGIYPDASLIFDSFGNLYGTTTLGGADGSGTVFEIKR